MLKRSSSHYHHHHQRGMEDVPGSMGTSAGFALRLGQAIFSSVSLLFMSFGVQFYSYTSFCFLVTIMGLVIPWSFTLAVLDGYSILVNPQFNKRVLSILTLGAASSTTSIVDVLIRANGSVCPMKFCNHHLLSIVSAFLSWFLSMASSLFNLWLLPSL